MSMDKLWAPWRIEYIRNDMQNEDIECFFCEYQKQTEKDKENLVLYRGNKNIVLMNYYPYNNGHLMVAPYIHTGELSDLDAETKLEMMELVDHSCRIMKDKMSAEGFNAGLNIGAVAGAGIDDHLHMHVVPRWKGDTNFMPVLGHTKVISEDLTETWEYLKKEFDKI
jgi:ATP adenylyltransferase